jgi:uncharacterized protein YjeT (DUF2065 family)
MRGRAALRLASDTLRCFGAVVMLAGAATAGAESTSGERRTSAQVSVQVTVPLVMGMQVRGMPERVVLTPQDIARGYVDVEAPVRLAVMSNHRHGYTLMLSHGPEFVQQAELQSPDGDLRFAGLGTLQRSVAGRGVRTDTLELRFRLHLAPAAREGHYAWPIQVSLADQAL